MINTQQLLIYVGTQVYGSVFRQRAKTLLKRSGGGGGKSSSPNALRNSDEVSEEITVWGDPNEGGMGSADVITLDPWLWDFKLVVEVHIPSVPITPPDNTPEVNPCQSLEHSLATLEKVLEAEKTALTALDQLIAKATSPAERRVLQKQKRETEKNIKETRQIIKDLKAELSRLEC